MFAVSDPVSGSVIAIDAQARPNRSCCSASPTDAMAELPRPWRGSESNRPTSPQHISAIDITDARLVPLRTRAPTSSSSDSSRLTPEAPAPELAPDSERPSIIAARRSSSLG